MSEINKVEKFLNIYETKLHNDVPEGVKKKSLAEIGAKKDCIDVLLKMKHGVLTSVKLALDGDDASDCIYTFRLLSAQEESDIFDEMEKLKYQPGIHYQYDIYYISKVLSRASKSIASDKPFTQPELTEEVLRKAFPKYLLLAIGIKYNEFREKVSPRLETLTEDQITEIINDINECEGSQKKLTTLSGLNLNQTHEVLLSLLSRLDGLTKQLDSVVIGS